MSLRLSFALAAVTLTALPALGQQSGSVNVDSSQLDDHEADGGLSVTGSGLVEIHFDDDEETLAEIREQQAGVSHASLDLGFRDAGLSFGNSAVWSGVRFNWHDRAVQRLRGLNVSIWEPGPNVDGSLAGLNLGIWGPRADELQGISVGLGSVRAREKLQGIWIGGLAVEAGKMNGIGASLLGQVSRGNASGIFVSGFANVSAGVQDDAFDKVMDDLDRTLEGIDEDLDEAEQARLAGEAIHTLQGDAGMHGIAIAGLANVRNGSVHGLQAAGFANVANGSVHGIQASFFANVTNGSVHGINAAGLANVTNGSMRGIEVAGLANVRNGSSLGLSGALLANVNNGSSRGINLAGLSNVSNGSSAGVGASLLANVNNGGATGLYVTGVANSVNGHAQGVFAGLGTLHADHLTGLGIGGVYTDVSVVDGALLGIWNEVGGSLSGVQIGVVNHAASIDGGVMIGVMNHVPSNPEWARWLPLVNLQF